MDTDPDDDGDNNLVEVGSPTKTPTEEPTPTDTPTPTDEPTPTDTPEPSVITHKIGERFTVGDGGQMVEYVINDASAYETIGGDALEIESDGVFLAVELTMTNRGDETFSVSSDLFTAVATDDPGNPDAEEARYDVVSGNSYIAADNSIEGEPILFEDIQPNIETDGAIAFDVPYGLYVALIIEPAGAFSTANDHLVNLGWMPTSEEI